MSVLWQITSREAGQADVKHWDAHIDERLCDITPLEQGVCGFRLYSWLQPELTPTVLERRPRRALMTTTVDCTVKARISRGGQPVTFSVPFWATLDDLNYRAKEVLGLNNDPVSWAEKLEGISVCFATPWGKCL